MSQSPVHSSPSRTRSKVRPRSATRGPLDPGENPIFDSTSSAISAATRSSLLPIPRTQSAPIDPHNASPFASPRYPPTPARSGFPTEGGTAHMAKDFSFLLRPEMYHPVTTLNTPAVFRSSYKQPLPTDSLSNLLSRGHFRAAAIAAVQELTGTLPPANPDSSSPYSPPPPVDPSDSRRIFSLLYTRLVCLVLIDATTLAAQEVKALEDLSNARYVDEVTGEHLVPWELRVLNVRLQAIGFGDPRRAVMSYYDLAREARERITRARLANEPDAVEVATLWTDRLHDLGVRVAGALVDMNDLMGAAHHLSTLKNRSDGKLAMAKALVWLQVGDTGAAMRCISGGADADRAGKIIAALCDMASAAYGPALDKWTELSEAMEDEMVAVNAATCHLYLGRIGEGREMLEKMVGEGYKSHTLLFNLATMYELCSDHNKDVKLKLADRLADLDEGPLGWEKTSADLKL